MSAFHLPPLLKKLRDIAPGIQVEVVAANELRDLQRREADIAIRHVRPEQPDLIARLIAEPSAYLYASSEYLDELGRPGLLSDLSRAAFVGFENRERSVSIFNSLGLTLTADNIRYLSGSGVVSWHLIKQGLGIGLMDENTAAITPGIEKALPALEPIKFPVWLTTHRELRTSRRIRIVWDFLVREIGLRA